MFPVAKYRNVLSYCELALDDWYEHSGHCTRQNFWFAKPLMLLDPTRTASGMGNPVSPMARLGRRGIGSRWLLVRRLGVAGQERTKPVNRYALKRYIKWSVLFVNTACLVLCPWSCPMLP